MILTDYYRFEKVALKSKMRLDCVASTCGYGELEEMRTVKAFKGSTTRDQIKEGALIIYLGDIPETFGGDVHRKADKCITGKGRNISSVYVPDVESGLAYGDFRGTDDAVLFVFENFVVKDGRIQKGSALEMLIARGRSKDRVALYNLFADGGLDEEINTLKLEASWDEGYAFQKFKEEGL